MTLAWILLGTIFGLGLANLITKYQTNIKTWVWYEWLVVLIGLFFLVFGTAWIITNITVIKSARGAGVGGIGALIIPVLLSGYIRGLLTKGSKVQKATL